MQLMLPPAANGNGIIVEASGEVDSSLDGVSFSKPSLCTSRTILEKFLLFLVFLCLIGFITVAVLLAVAHVEDAARKEILAKKETSAAQLAPSERSNGESDLENVPETPEICATAGCVKAAANLLSAIDTSVDPCDDFYTYACGQWNKDNPIPDDMPNYGTFAAVRERVTKQMRTILESPSDPEGGSRSIRMAKAAYKLCMNSKRRLSENSTRLRAALDTIGPFPILDGEDFDNSTFDLTDLLARTKRDFGNDVFIQLYIYADARDTNKNIIHLDQGALGLGHNTKAYYLNETAYSVQLKAYRIFMAKVVGLLAKDGGHASNRQQQINDVVEIFRFEQRMAEIIVSDSERRNHTRMYNKIKVKDLANYVPNINWEEYFKIVLPEDVKLQVTDETDVIIAEPEYLNQISHILATTNPRLLTNYIVWRFTQSWVKLLDPRFDDLRQEFMRVMSGQMQKPAAWKDCVPGPDNWLPLAAGSMYVRERFDENSKKEALEMINNLLESFTDLVSDLSWMDDKTKQTALQKAHSILNHIGYPDFILDDNKLDKHYEGLEFTEDESYFQVVLKIMNWTQVKEFRKLNKPFSKKDFEVSPAVVNAFYSPEKNAITFPAGILQPPFFSGEYPKSINYGAIGAVIGHEITHGFDDQGSQFDKDGNLRNWWSKTAFERFQNKTQCIINQYASYYVEDAGLHVDGKLTQGENIADNGGVKEAFGAYQKYIAKRGSPEPRLPGLQNYTHNQLFFLSYAHFWCGHKTTRNAQQQLLMDVHSPELFRVIGVLSNLDEFSTAYNCKPGTKLNPFKSSTSKCVVW